MKNICKLSVLILFFLPILLFGQEKSVEREIRWTGIETVKISQNESLKMLNFIGAVNDEKYGLLPVYSEKFYLDKKNTSFDFTLANEKFIEFTDQVAVAGLLDIDKIKSEIIVNNNINISRRKRYSNLTFVPLRKNRESGKIEKLISFEIIIKEKEISISQDSPIHKFANKSVLSEGDWYKIAVSESGIYRLTYEDLQNMGMNVDAVDPDNIKVYGNGGGMLPEKNSEFRYDDLIENAIFVNDGNDNSFDPGDYILFYGQSPDIWEYVPIKLAFVHTKNNYSDFNHYFITAGQEAGKRIDTLPTCNLQPTEYISKFNDYSFHDEDKINLIKSGSVWYGEEFGDCLSYDFQFDFPNIDTSYTMYLVSDVAARSTTMSSFVYFINNDSITTSMVPAIPPSSSKIFAQQTKKSKRFKTSSNPINLNVSYDKPNDNALGWLNYIEINVMRYLKFTGSQLLFCNIYSAGSGKVSEFTISDAQAGLKVWDITNPLDPKIVNGTFANNEYVFTLRTDSLREFVAYNGVSFMKPELVGYVENQNLHGLGGLNFIIVCYPDFIEQAERLKKLHVDIDNMSVCIVKPEEIYNEFSSGSQDITAIRDFVRMIYNRSGDPLSLKYLLLFGDGSYDNKDRIPGNLNPIPTFQTKQSLKLTSSYVTDDFYGLMDPNEGKDAYGDVDIGIGRLPVNTPEQAASVIDKIEHYMKIGPAVLQSWRNEICFVADDEDNNLHFYQADTILAKMVARENKSLNINKIYLDAYQQISTSSGHRYPEVNTAINKQMQNGAIIMNYTGHGGEMGWAEENVLEITDINSWTNFDKMPVFIAATCKFSCFDNPAMTSAGEHVLLNPNGGGIGLFTTTRLAFSQANLTLNRRIYDTLFASKEGKYPKLGDMIMFSKTPSNSNIRNFVLLGDPALSLAFPKFNILTDSINGKNVAEFNDTIRAGSKVTVSGHVADYNIAGSINEDFNGVLYPVIYDKSEELSTRGNDFESSPEPFSLQNNILFKGKTEVENGSFSFSFIVPMDISYQFGKGKISYYAADTLNDATGYFNDFIIGGVDENANNDFTGPEIELFLNDTLFINGSAVNVSPVLLAGLFDETGINSVGNGIGHDIVAVLNNNTSQTIILNDYFEPDMNNYKSGSIVFPMNELTIGHHTLELKAWDMLNNSSSKIIDFFVSDSIPVNISGVINYPNPFRDWTYFTFQHNQFGNDLKVEINIFNINGQLVKIIGPENVYSSGYYISPIYWDGDDDRGNKLNPGFYFYKLKVENELGSITERVRKLIISN